MLQGYRFAPAGRSTLILTAGLHSRRDLGKIEVLAIADAGPLATQPVTVRGVNFVPAALARGGSFPAPRGRSGSAVPREKVLDSILTVGRHVAIGMSASFILLHGLPHPG
jgi:hypothetical protein